MPAAPTEAEYFDQLVADAGEFNPFTDRGWATLARCFRRAAGDSTYRRLVDIGCGTGRSRSVYDGMVRQYVGLDLSFEAVRVATRHESGGQWLQADALRLPLRSETADAVAFSSVLHHVPDIDAALTEARRVVEPGGLVFAFDPNVLHPAMLLFRHPRSPLYSQAGVSPHERPLHPATARDAFARAGLTDVGQRCQSDIPYRRVAVPLLDRLLPAYNALDRAWERSGLARWMGTFVVTWGRRPA